MTNRLRVDRFFSAASEIVIKLYLFMKTIVQFGKLNSLIIHLETTA